MDVHEYAAPQEFHLFGTDARGSYLNAIRWVDDGLARVMALLEERGMLDDTLMVLGSDHGETFGENGKVGHAKNVLSAVLHVPLVVRMPVAMTPVRVSTQVRNLDIAPTLLDLLHVPVPESFEGRSLVPAIVGSERGDPVDSIAALGLPLYPDASVQVSLRHGDWTYARNIPPDEPRELLFDRSIDPGEDVDLSTREPAEMERLRAVLDEHLDDEVREEVRESGVAIDPEIERRLRAMGYLQ
jgi:arylsulfatase A-like enzyme